MAIYQILKCEDELLKVKSKPVEKINKNILKLLDNMSETMYAAKGVGLAAPQIGVLKRVVVIDIGEGLIELINPTIEVSNGQKADVEGCLSVPGLTGEVVRATEIVVTALNREGKKTKIVADGLLARAIQHEIDHLNGVLFIDIAQNIEKVN